MDTQTSPESVGAKDSINKNASWGAIISIIIILAMVVVGAFYAWGQRIAEERAMQLPIPQGSVANHP